MLAAASPIITLPFAKKMTPELQSFLSQYIALPPEVLQEISDLFKEKRVGKNEYLLKEGQVCRDFVFVQSGCLRMYYTAKETEISVWFAFPYSSAIEIASYISERPSEYSIQAIEDSTVLFLPKSSLDRLYGKYPEAQEMMRKFWEDVVLHLIPRFTALQKDSAEKRYLDLMSNTDYLEKIPQKYLASFIGVTPTSLSRIRRNIK